MVRLLNSASQPIRAYSRATSRPLTDGGVLDPGCVQEKRGEAGGGVRAASRVAEERFKSEARVAAARSDNAAP